MARTISFQMWQALTAEQTDENPVCLLTITHPDLPEPIRLSSDDTQRLSVDPLMYGTISRGNTYLFLPFSVVLPDDKEEAAPSAKLQIDNIDRNLIPILRSTDTPAHVQMEIVLASSPDSVEIEFPELDLASASYDETSIQIELGIDSLQVEPFPADTFAPSSFPGLF